MEYKIVKKMTWKGLEEEVNIAIKEGWLPQGNPIVDSNNSCVQAMIKQST